MKPTLLIIGASGFVGSELAARARATYQVLEPSPDELDITDEAAIHRAIDSARPDAVAMLAAIADIDQCESQPELTWRINADAPRAVAQACQRNRARLLYTSSAAVFDGSCERYLESDPPAPVSVYGRTKAEAERSILALLPNSPFLRPALVLGRARRTGTNSFQDKLVAALRAGKRVVAPVFEYRNPIDVATLAQAMLALLANPQAGGAYHIGSTQAVSRYQLACLFADRLGVSRSLIEPQLEPTPGRAPRGAHHFLISTRLEQATGLTMPDIDTLLENALNGSTESII